MRWDGYYEEEDKMRFGVLYTEMYTGQRTEHHDTNVDEVRRMDITRAFCDERDTAMASTPTHREQRMATASSKPSVDAAVPAHITAPTPIHFYTTSHAAMKHRA